MKANLAAFSKIAAFATFLALTASACKTMQVAGNEDGSQPINEEEQREYMKSIRRCHKMGGTRIVKVQGELRCF